MAQDKLITLDNLSRFKGKLGTAALKDVPTSGNASSSQVVMGNDSRLSDARNAADVFAWAKASSKPSYTASEVGAIASTAKGAANGVAELGSDGKVPSGQLPSYVDDVLEYDSKSSFPTTGEAGKIYVDKTTNLTWRWSGTTYVEISPSLALGETSSTAYRGDRGKIAYDHSQSTHARTDATAVAASSTNGNITINGTETTVYTHPGSGTNPHGTTKSDVGLGNVGNFKAVSTVASQGLTDTEKSNARANIGAGTSSFSGSYNDLSNKPTIPTKVSQLTNDSGYTTNTGTITGINMNGASKGTSGVVDLGTVITSHQDISGKADKSATVSNVAWDSTNKKLTKTINGTTSDVVTGATILGGLTKSQVTTALGYTPPTSDTNTHRPIQVNGTEILGDNTTALNLKAGSNVSVTNSSGTVTIAATDTTYSDATTSAHGLMTAADKTKLNSIVANTGTAAAELKKIQIGNTVYSTDGMRSFDVSSISSGSFSVGVNNAGHLNGEVIAVNTGSYTGTTSNAWVMALNDGQEITALTISKADGTAFKDAISANSLLFVKCNTSNNTAILLGIVGVSGGGGVAESVVGTVENNSTASKAYAVGEHFIRNDKFCTVIAAIASGATLTLNTNYVEGTIADNITKRVNYSTTEHVIGTWIDGSTLYEKTVAYGQLPNNSEIFRSTGISSAYTIVYMYGIAFDRPKVAGQTIVVPSADPQQNSWGVGFGAKISGNEYVIGLKTTIDYSDFKKCYVTIRYVKENLNT